MTEIMLELLRSPLVVMLIVIAVLGVCTAAITGR